MSHKLEAFARDVAVSILGTQQASAPGLPDPQKLLDFMKAIMQIVMEMLTKCPAKAARFIAAMKSPTLIQQARFALVVQKQCDACTGTSIRQYASQIEAAITSHAQGLGDADLVAIVDEARSDDWMVV